jgi:two-component system phosphate regulon sensor histidine kinase PhoR
MIFRLFSFLAVLVLACLGGWLVADWQGVALGAAAGSLVWFMADLSRGIRYMTWLRVADSRSAPAMRGLWGEVTDRTRRLLRDGERRAMEQEQRLQDFLSAIQASPNGVVLLDEAGRIEWCNETAAGHFGFDPQRDLLQHIGNLVRDPAFAAYAAGGDFRHEITLAGRADSPQHPVRLSVQLHPYGDGRKLLLSRDVTALAQAEAMRRDFVANVSHEIRTPLTVLSGFVETLQTLPLDADEQSRYLALMAAQAERMRTLVNDLLMLSQLEGSPPPGEAEVVSLAELTGPCEDEGRGLSAVLYATPLPPQQLQFEVPEGAGLAGAVRELRSAISNLVSNAVRYTPAGGRIDARWSTLPDGRLEFAVSDTGPGIAPEHLPRLSERFYRVDRSRSRESGGTGLGLAIAKHVVQRHGGELRITSTPGKGSRFALVFPAVRRRDLRG